MQSKNEPRMPSNDERLAILETVIVNINTTLVDIRQDSRRFEDKINESLNGIRQDSKRFEDKINESLNGIRQDNKRLEDSIRQDIRRLDEKVDRVDQKFEAKFDAVDRKFERVENRLWSIFIWQLGAFGGLAVFIAHLHKLI